MSVSVWNQKGGALSDKSARKEFGLTQEEIIDGIRGGKLQSQFQNVPFCPISALGSNCNPRNTLCIPVVKIFAFLDLEQT